MPFDLTPRIRMLVGQVLGCVPGAQSDKDLDPSKSLQ